MDSINPQPNVPAAFVPAKSGDTFKLGTLTIRIMEDGSHTGSVVVDELSTQPNPDGMHYRQPTWSKQ